VTLDAIGFNQVELMAAGQQDIVVGYAANEPIQLRAQGIKCDRVARGRLCSTDRERNARQ
jgi:hypothetical protein